MLRILASSFLLMLAVGFAPALYAQSSQDKFEVSFQANETKRRATIASVMLFTGAEAAKFWPLYDAYRARVKDHQLQRILMLEKLSESMVGMGDEVATEVVNNALQLERDQERRKRDFISDLHPILTGARYFRYYQVETKLDAMFTYGWTQQIPLAITEDEAKGAKP